MEFAWENLMSRRTGGRPIYGWSTQQQGGFKNWGNKSSNTKRSYSGVSKTENITEGDLGEFKRESSKMLRGKKQLRKDEYREKNQLGMVTGNAYCIKCGVPVSRGAKFCSSHKQNSKN